MYNLLAHTAPPLGVQGLCTFVVWYAPDVPCVDIRGYEVRLYHPQSAHSNATIGVWATGTFYVVDNLLRSDDYVQVPTTQTLL